MIVMSIWVYDLYYAGYLAYASMSRVAVLFWVEENKGQEAEIL